MTITTRKELLTEVDAKVKNLRRFLAEIENEQNEKIEAELEEYKRRYFELVEYQA